MQLSAKCRVSQYASIHWRYLRHVPSSALSMASVGNFGGFRRALIVMCALAMTFVSQAALPLDSPETFFTNVADRLLQQQLGLRLTQIQIAPTNQYDAAVHRIFQVTANIYDATSTNEFPTVFRPLFNATGNGVFLAGFTYDNQVSTLPSWLDSNPYGIPMVIAARKGLPNFNEFTMRTDLLMQRKLQLTRPSNGPGTRPNATNQMYVLSISNFFGVESWNAYPNAPSYPRELSIVVSNFTTATLANGFGVQGAGTFAVAANNMIPAQSWPGGLQGTNAFRLTLNTITSFMDKAVYRFNGNYFTNNSTNAFEIFAGYPLPYWILTISNRVTYFMTEPGTGRILDFVSLQDGTVVDLFRDLVASNPYDRIGGGMSSTIAGVWNTNRAFGPTGATEGIRRQLDISLGILPTANSDWRTYALTTTTTENNKNAAVNGFRYFAGLAPLTPDAFQTNTTLQIETPFNPAAKLAVLSTWQANDPLVHYHVSDLKPGGGATNLQYLKPTQPATNVSPSSLAYLNFNYSSWGGNPLASFEGPTSYNRSVIDPGVYSADQWNFPTNETLSTRWLGRVHRGTPWQTIYLKADAAPFWVWTNQSSDLVLSTNGGPYSRTHPTNDWRLAALLASLLNTNDVRTLTSINTTNANSWAATLAGLTTLSNIATTPILGQPVPYQTNSITIDALQTLTIVSGINRVRSANRGEYFVDVAEFLSVPELSSASPWLNLTGAQPKWGMTDEAYEILPSQLLGLIRFDPVGTVLRSSNAFELRFTAFDGYAFRVESSMDLAAWTTVSEPHYSTNGVFALTLPASDQPQFFRAVLVQ